MFFPKPQPQAQPPAMPPQAAPQQQAMPQIPPLPNVSGFKNPMSGQANNYAPIPPDEVKRWAELNHTSKGSIKQVEWSQNSGQYLFTLKGGDVEKVSPQYIMQNQGHWAPHPDHANEAVKFIAASQVKQRLPMIMAAMRNLQAGQRPMGNAPAPMGATPPGVPQTPQVSQQGPIT